MTLRIWFISTLSPNFKIENCHTMFHHLLTKLIVYSNYCYYCLIINNCGIVLKSGTNSIIAMFVNIFHFITHFKQKSTEKLDNEPYVYKTHKCHLSVYIFPENINKVC